MTQPNRCGVSTITNVNVFAFKTMQQDCLKQYGKEINDLNYVEAAQLVGAHIVAEASLHATTGSCVIDGAVTLETHADGYEAILGRSKKLADELNESSQGEAELIINVVRKARLGKVRRHHKLKTLESFRFYSEPPEYAL